MKRLFLLLLLGAQIVASQALAGEYLVKYKSSSVMSLFSNPNIQVKGEIRTGHLFKIDVKESEKAEVLADLLASPSVEYVVPNFKLHALSAPIEPNALKEQWAIAKVNAEKAWQRAGNKGSKNVVVAVIDTGVDYGHQSLKSNMVQGYDFREKDNDPMDKTSSQNPGHGTHCAGIIGATGLVDGGIVGISPEVSMMPLRFLGEDGSGDLESAIKSIDYAIEKKVDVISASWGAAVPRNQAQPLIEAVKRADDAGIIFVAAAANDGQNNDKVDMYPANTGLPNTITVAASGPNDEKPSWSNYGRARVHVAAPGLNIMSTLPKNSYGNLSGTSMATPLVSGLVALLKAQDKNLTGVQIRALLQSTGAKVGIETACKCRVDAFAAVDTVMSKKMFIAPSAGTLGVGEKQTFTAVYGQGPFKFSSSDANVATINDSGELTAVANGQTIVTVTDSTGATASSVEVYVGASKGNNPPDDGGGGMPPPGGGEPGECPIGDPALCQIICQIQPNLPFCQ